MWSICLSKLRDVADFLIHRETYAVIIRLLKCHLTHTDGDMASTVFPEAADKAAKLGDTGPDHRLEPQVGAAVPLPPGLLVSIPVHRRVGGWRLLAWCPLGHACLRLAVCVVVVGGLLSHATQV